jgi:hypothetical protein
MPMSIEEQDASALTHKGATRKRSRSKDRGGISTGGTYLRVDKVERIAHLLVLQGREATKELIQQLADELFQFPDERVDEVLAQQEFQAAAFLAFPEQAQMICRLSDFALRIAQMRRLQDDIHATRQVKDKLLQEEVPQFYETLHLKELGQSDTTAVLLRLANIVYYAVQAFAHDLRLTARNGEFSLDELRTAIDAFQQTVTRYCTAADQSVITGITAAYRKFGYLSLVEEKVDEILRKLMEDLPQ